MQRPTHAQTLPNDVLTFVLANCVELKSGSFNYTTFPSQ
jgi:hypothetical protein